MQKVGKFVCWHFRWPASRLFIFSLTNSASSYGRMQSKLFKDLPICLFANIWGDLLAQTIYCQLFKHCKPLKLHHVQNIPLSNVPVIHFSNSYPMVFHFWKYCLNVRNINFWENPQQFKAIKTAKCRKFKLWQNVTCVELWEFW